MLENDEGNEKVSTDLKLAEKHIKVCVREECTLPGWLLLDRVTWFGGRFHGSN